MTRPTIEDVWAEIGSIVAPSTAKVQVGWAAEIPPSEYQNWWQNRADLLLEDLEQNGVMTWLALTVYKLGAFTFASDNNVYVSLVAGNVNNEPTISPNDWVSLSDLFTAGDASSSEKGIVELATTVETQTGTDDSRAVTPKGLKESIQQVVPDASTSIKGKIQLASTGEAQSGTNTTKAITPSSLKTVTATTSRAGLVERATDGEAAAGTDTTRYLSPKQVKDRIDAIPPFNVSATTSTKGIVELATNSETKQGSSSNRAVTPASLKSALSALGIYQRSVFINVQSAGVTSRSAALNLAKASLQESGLIDGSTMTVRRQVLDTIGTGNGTTSVPAIIDAAYKRVSSAWQYNGETDIGHIK